ncbi:MAG: prepilin-type N-terminal cleavage/methylation domain-containing protein [Candidatus Andersenbacteria bacterium]|nr:prepilin-type N-terminal cleavage/methylation domain-containing protein [bacterium]MDZ4225472.1 prepilin-type N-terminal cleavage/methylation domain-containing protein [Candidatus Andersenbacteria bacterium]
MEMNKRKIFDFNKRQLGLSLVELLMVIAVGSILIIALVMFVGRAFNISREQVEQTRTTEDARIQLERMSDTIRNSRPVDCNDDGYTDSDWLVAASNTGVMVISNTDEDATPEKVHYYLDEGSSDLMRQVIQMNATCSETPEAAQIIARTVRNQESVTPVFSYYDIAGNKIEPDADGTISSGSLSDVVQVGVDLVVDVNEQQEPSAYELSTRVTVRSEVCEEGDCGEKQCYEPESKALGSLDYFGDFAYDAFYQCSSYCDPGVEPLQESCCDWSVGFNGNSVGNTVNAYCVCGGSGIPANVDEADIVNNVTVNEYSDLFRDCWNGTTCGMYIKGTAYSNPPSCFSAGSTGQFACQCP